MSKILIRTLSTTGELYLKDEKNVIYAMTCLKGEVMYVHCTH